MRYNNSNYTIIPPSKAIINQVGYCDKTYLNQIVTDQFVSSWYNDIENSSRGQFYGSFKKDFGLENYFVYTYIVLIF